MRKHERRTTELPVVVSDAANRVKAGIRFGAADVSTGGAFLRSDLLFEVGELLNLEIQLPAARLIKARGRVVRVSRDSAEDRVPGMGIEFVDLSAEDRAAIEATLR
jgi:Tfp pilus assembly protein PilZ